MLSSVSDLSLSGYEFHDSVTPSGWRNGPQGDNDRDQSEMARDGASVAKSAGLTLLDKKHGTGPLATETSVVSFHYLIQDASGKIVSRNDQGPPVCFTFA